MKTRLHRRSGDANAGTRAQVASRLAILLLLVASALLDDGTRHAHSHWLSLAAYGGATVLLAVGAVALGPFTTVLDAALAGYVLVEHAAVADPGRIGTDVVSQMPAILFLLSTALDGSRRRTIAFGGLVGAAWLAALAVAAGRGAAASELNHLAVALAAFAVATAFVVEGVTRLRRSMLDADRSERERTFLSRFVPPGAGRAKEEGLRERHACLLAVDVRGFSELTRRHDPSDVAHWLLGLRRTVNAAVAAEGGVVDKYVGDGVIAHFMEGRPDEQAAAALRTVDRVRSALADANAKRVASAFPPFSLVFALHAGEVLAGMLDDGLRAEITVLGAPMNALARIERRAKVEGVEILASKRFVRLLGHPVPADARLPRVAGEEETPDVVPIDGSRRRAANRDLEVAT